jgi:hypothetical protein
MDAKEDEQMASIFQALLDLKQNLRTRKHNT